MDIEAEDVGDDELVTDTVALAEPLAVFDAAVSRGGGGEAKVGGKEFGWSSTVRQRRAKMLRYQQLE